MSDSALDPLAALRDIQEPLAPGLWTLAPGWWLLGLITTILLIWLAWRLYQTYRLFRPYHLLRRLARQTNIMRKENKLDAREYANQINELYKRLMVHVEASTRASRLFGDPWLSELEQRFPGTTFMEGPGRCLGSARFSQVAMDDQGLIDLVEQTLGRIRPPRHKRKSGISDA